MRVERDAIGEIELSDETLFGIGTARLLAAVPPLGPQLPVAFAEEILQLRKRQAVEWGRQGVWDPQLVTALCRAVDRLLSEQELLRAQSVIRPLQDATGRSIVGNLDEMISNLVLLDLGARTGDYFRFPALVQFDIGIRRAEVFAAASRAATDTCVKILLVAIDSLLEQLAARSGCAGREPLLIRMQSMPVALYPADTGWSVIESDILRTREALDRLRNAFPVFSISEHSNEIGEVDYYQRIGNEVATLLSKLCQLANYCKMLLEKFGDSKWPRLRSPDSLNPGYEEPLYADFVIQTSFFAQAKLSMITQIRTQSIGDLEAFVPLISVESYDVIKVAETLCRLFSEEWLPRLPMFGALLRLEADEAPLQAEQLIPLIGYDRSVQVARMSALTGKTVRSVVEKMKVLAPEQLALLFPVEDVGNKKGDSL